MKKKLWIPLLLVLLLAGSILCYGASSAASFDQIMGSSQYPWEFEPSPGWQIGVPHYPSFGDLEAVDQRPYQAVLSALRSTKYIPLPVFLTMKDGGTVVQTGEGCSPGYMAYWKGGILWLPVEGSWRPYLPTDEAGLKKEIASLVNRYGYKIKGNS